MRLISSLRRAKITCKAWPFLDRIECSSLFPVSLLTLSDNTELSRCEEIWCYLEGSRASDDVLIITLQRLRELRFGSFSRSLWSGIIVALEKLERSVPRSFPKKYTAIISKARSLTIGASLTLADPVQEVSVSGMPGWSMVVADLELTRPSLPLPRARCLDVLEGKDIKQRSASVQRF